ncbi:MAG TPA: DUF2130 domain-containing protein [Candidatus Gracilibacteria bacterium]
MQDQNVTCPKCGHQFPLTDSFRDEIRSQLQKDNEAQLEKEKKAMHARAKAWMEKQMEEEKSKFEKEGKEKIEQKIKEQYDLQLKDLKAENDERKKKLEEMQKAELELRKKTRDLEEKEKNMELELQRKIDETLKSETLKQKEAWQSEQKKKDLENQQQMEQMRKTIEELRRKSEQGSMQIQGDAQEEDLKRTLQMAFPADSIDDVPTGIKGADLIQTVRNNFGRGAGIILWESKNTKQWTRDWIKKLKDDQVTAKADLCILITRAMPDDVKHFGIVDGVWVCEYAYALPLVQSLRHHLTEVTNAKKSLEGQDEKMKILYLYLSGPEFRNRIEGMVSAFQSLKEGLDQERRAMERIWARREKEINRMMTHTSGLYGDMQGLIGASLPTIETLELEGGSDLDQLELGDL